MKKSFKIGLLILTTLALSNCSGLSSDSSGSIKYSVGGLAFKAVDGALGNAEGLINGNNSRSLSSSDDLQTRSSGLSGIWTASATYNNPKYDGSCSGVSQQITLKDYMGTQFESTEVRCNGSSINIFGRLNNAAGIVCIIMNTLSANSSAELASAADQTITFTTAMVNDLKVKCPEMADDIANFDKDSDGNPGNGLDGNPLSATLQFDTPAVTTSYDLKVSILPFNNTVFMKYGTGSVINFAKNEDGVNGSNRTLISYDQITKVLRAEYISTGSASSYPLYIHRLYMDDTNNIGRIFSQITSGYGNNTTTTEGNREAYVVSGHPGSNTIALSMDLFNMNVTDGVYEACVDGSNGNITNDNLTVDGSNNFTCGTTASNSKAMGFVTSGSQIESHVKGNLATWWQVTTGSEILSWTDRDNMLTSGF